MASHGLSVPENCIVSGRYDDVENIRFHIQTLLERPDRPSCILLPDDASYFGALDAIRGYGLEVPRDISVAGYDGIRSVQAIHPRLTTVRQDSDAMGREAALRLIEHIDHANAAASASVLIPATLVEGESMGPAPADGERIA